MTKIEKECVFAALSEYAFNHQKAADKARKCKDYKAQLEHQRQANNAMSIISYWREVVNMPCGTVKI